MTMFRANGLIRTTRPSVPAQLQSLFRHPARLGSGRSRLEVRCPFSKLGLSDKVLAAVQAAGYPTPTPIQEQAIPHVLARRDVLGIAQTGTGKTAAFALPMLTMLEQGRARARMPRTLILEPTRELAAQVEESFVKYGVRPQAQRRPHHRRRVVRRPGHQAHARRRRADRDARAACSTISSADGS